MNPPNYDAIFKQVTNDIEAKQKELGECLRNAEVLEAQIAGLQMTAVGLARTLSREYVLEDALGLTDAIRSIFRADGRNYTALEIRDALQSLGYDITKYGNVMASIHSVLKRLIDQGQIREAGIRGSNNKPTFEWAQRITKTSPPPRTL